MDRAFIVGIQNIDSKMREDERLVRGHLQELRRLCDTMGLETADEALVKIKETKPRYLIGEGKTAEICDMAKKLECTIIVFDDDLSPSQQRNWEELSGLCVIDRREVILEIFAGRARTKEATLQTALARLEYSLPRLTRAWTHLSRQRGGTKGTKGEGETQLESDRRVILKKIAAVKRDLETVKRYRAVQRKRRQSVPVPVVSLIGYTNAGKSSLLNRVTGADVLVENKLFATLDPTTRRVKTASGMEFLFSDTVGFIRKLPHTLVESFNATLEETLQADLLLHVIDASNTDWAEHYAAVEATLKEIGAAGKPVLIVFNKMDAADNPMDVLFIRKRFPDALFVSAKTGEGLDVLTDAVAAALYRHHRLLRLVIPQTRWDLVAYLHRNAVVLGEECLDGVIHIHARVTEKDVHVISAFITEIF